ncbi:hypothetical protein [Roseomonas harenae]|jgi:hypothetical protein|uniref:hypothetical protein n=1 Tax=Muricoccus harenae TaxID=2692566 RepID=UPI00133188B1|nr:hypothetical protein [Roseomonas harenae]
MNRPPPLLVVLITLAGLGLALFVVLDMGRGGVGLAHYMAGAIIALVGAGFAMMKGKR